MQRLEAKLLVEENMTIQNMDCVLRLKANKWIVSFLYHDEPVCLELCRDYLPKCYLKTVAEWTVEDYLEKRNGFVLMEFSVGGADVPCRLVRER